MPAYEIQGDWSSDVCSSDLDVDRHGLVRHRREGDARDVPVGAGVAPGAVPVRLPVAVVVVGRRSPEVGFRARLDQRQDRKSVVEGKSVDLGGRRIIKKKKIK